MVAGRKKDGWDGKRTGNTGHLRSLAVTKGHSKTPTDQGRKPLTRYSGIGCMRVRFPPAPLCPQMPSDQVFVELGQGRQIPPSYAQGCDQEKYGRAGRGNLGGATPRVEDRAPRNRWSTGVLRRPHSAGAAKGRTTTR
jgi:hypothetical protein